MELERWGVPKVRGEPHLGTRVEGLIWNLTLLMHSWSLLS